MKIFKDIESRCWEVSVTAGTIRRVLDLTGVNLDKEMREGTIYTTVSDVVTFVNILYAVCKPQADKLGIGDAQFGELLAGDSITSAADALVDAMVDFTPSATVRTATRQAVEMARKSQRQAEQSACDEMLRQLEASLSTPASGLPE